MDDRTYAFFKNVLTKMSHQASKSRIDKRLAIINVLMLMIIFALIEGCQEQHDTKIDSASGKIDIEKAKAMVERIDKQFSKDFYNGDSVALANYYTDDAKLGALKGKEILSFWGRAIRNSVKDSTRNLLFTTTAFTGDSDYVVELGVYEERDDKNNLKNKGKYLVVWKEEKGEWKIYRDIGL